VLPLAITDQSLETIAWGRPQIAKIISGVKIAQLPPRDLDQIGGKALGSFAVKDRLSCLVPEGLDHPDKCIIA
jgi:hypothetical protein